MSAGYSQTTITGNLGGDPELRYTPSGNAVASFNVAVSRRYKSGDEGKEETTWFRVTVWNELAETCNQYLAKGRPVMVVGRVKLNQWKSQGGEARASLEINANLVQFLGDRTPDSDSDGGYAPRHADNAEEETVEADNVEDLPW